MNYVFKKIDQEQELSKEDIVCLLALKDEQELARLYDRADRVRQKYVGDEVHLRGLIEFSNYCRKNCNYCGIRRGNRKLQRYRMSAEEILATVAVAERLGYKTVVLQSGEDMYYTVGKLVDIIRRIKQEADVAITLSIGERSREEYERLHEAGADRFLIRFETSNRELYSRLHPDSDYDERMQILVWLKEIGYQVGSGVMIGLPGQTLEDLAMDILKFRELDLDMVGVGPYICHEETPLAGNANGTVEMTFKVIALTRIVTRDAHIPATTALATLRPTDGREKALELGANVVMPNVTPAKYRALYELYPAKVCIGEEAEQCQACMHGRIYSLGRPISQGYGHSFKRAHLLPQSRCGN
ncbi:[FeFe] hydrogenase H-cluster radical SAM maturase HydE [Syntrophothermus sp.]|uniref:[FeFe] hydrogenase H-cluster radical SAM maturase HydE n=1 Tax=Syntrophothermus sp. TaxID=2736299 RepID=UPI00257D7D0B|nr:[FeFe] hydrogenase H-cluster radical SAM maturase HydE [Syntrophothermus sp.]